MSINTLLHELWRFVKDSWLKILVGAVIFGLLGLGAYQAVDYFFASEEDQTEALATLAPIYEQEPAEFQAVIMTNEGDIFANSYVFDEYFTRSAVLEEIGHETGVDLLTWQESELALNLNKTPQFRGGIAAIRNTSSNVITFRFLVADNAEDNLKVAEAYADLMTSGGVPFTENQTVHIINPPAIGELLDLEKTTEVPTEETLSAYAGNSYLLPVLAFVAGALLGIFVTIVFLLFIRLFRSTIGYAFDYSWEFDDHHQIINQPIDGATLQSIVDTPAIYSRLVVSQDDNVPVLGYAKSLNQVEEPQSNPDEIVLLVKSCQTSKEWFRQQYDLASLYQSKIRIVHLV